MARQTPVVPQGAERGGGYLISACGERCYEDFQRQQPSEPIKTYAPDELAKAELRAYRLRSQGSAVGL
jgi:hypothetical protein